MRRLFVVVFVVVAARASVAHACEIASPSLYVLRPVASGDSTPPDAPSVTSKVVEPKSRQTMGIALGGCADIGRIRLTVSGKDDRALPKDLGYRLKVVGDRGGMNMVLPDAPIAATDGEIVLPFRGDDAFELTLEISAVDPSGNVGPVTIHVVRVPAAFPWMLVLGIGIPVLAVLAIVGIVRRRRAARGGRHRAAPS